MADQVTQPNPILQTKLFVPRLQPGHVVRPQLLQQVNEGLHRKLTLISAPAGFGKTTLLSSWISTCKQPVAWLSLDDGDNDPARFLSYVIAALQTIKATIGAGVQGAFDGPRALPTEAILTALLNDISTAPEQIVFVLDDYHLIDSEPVDRILAFLLDHQPAQLHLVIATRQDPPFPLTRLRARGELTEVRADDLRFATPEAAAFLNESMQLNLSAGDIATLEERTEGWIAGLQLAALSLKSHQDVPAFIRAFAGDHRYIVDYLVDEVLQRQPPPVRSFLLQTAVLDRLHGPLCDAVTGQNDGSARLESLAHGNFFVVPLDNQRQWYRYHQLFADVLRTHLQAEQPELVATLHRRASEWFEHHGSESDAIRHALAADDFERAATLIERELAAVRAGRLSMTLLGWLKELPDELLRRRPVLNAAYASVLMNSGELDGVKERLDDAERWLDAKTYAEPGVTESDMIVVVEEEFRRLHGLIAAYRAGYAHLLGDIPETMEHAQHALELVPEVEHVTRGAAAALLGLACWANGELEAAQRHYAAGMRALHQAGLLSDVINGANTVAAIMMAQGRLNDAERTLEQAMQRAVELGEPSLHGTPDFLIGLSELRRERNDLETATEHLTRSQEIALSTGASRNRSRWSVAMARIKEAQGNLDAALALLDEAEGLRLPDFFPNARPVAALKGRVWIAQGRFDEVLYWTREQGLSTDDDLSYLHEFEHITLARMFLAQHATDAARRSTHETMTFLERLLQAAEDGRRMGSVVEVLILQALALHSRGDTPGALVPLERALALAEPENYVRIFVDEGTPIAALLSACAKRGIAPAYVRKLLAAFDEPEDSTPTKQNLIEPLSEREIDVLRLLRSDLDGPEIARELNVSLNTLRTHTKNIYSKLGVNSRRSAVRRSEELNLLSRSR